MKVSIDISDEQAKFLKQFAANQYPDAHDNLGTYKPIHLVQTSDYYIIWDGGGSGDEVYINNDNFDGECFDTPEALVAATGVENVISYEDALYSDALAGKVVFNENDYFKAYGINACKVSRRHEWRTVAYFFTLAEARRYKEYQAHNLKDPRTYTVSGGYGNKGDYKPFWNLLMQIGKTLMEGDAENAG